MLSPPIARAGQPQSSTPRNRIAPTPKATTAKQPILHYNSYSANSFNTVVPEITNHILKSKVAVKPLHELNVNELHYSVNRYTLLFSETLYETEYVKQLNVRYNTRLTHLMCILLCAVSLDLILTSIDYSVYTDIMNDMRIKLILQCITIGLVSLLSLHTYVRQHYRTVAQLLLCIHCAAIGCIWSVAANYTRITYIQQSYTIMGLITVLSIFGTRIMYFLSVAISIILINIVYTVFAIYYVVANDTVFDIENIYSILLYLFVSTILLYNVYTKESSKRYLFVCELKIEFSKRTNTLLKNEAMEMRGHMYVMTLEHYNIADFIGGSTRESLMSPMELAMEKLQQICATQQHTLHKDVFLDLQKIISWLGSSSDIFKPKLAEAMHNGNIQIDKETERWINEIVGDDENTDDGVSRAAISTYDSSNSALNPPVLLTRQSHDAGGVVSGRNTSHSSSIELSRQYSTFVHNIQTTDEKLFTDLMSTIDQWDFDVFEIANLTKNKPLLFIGTALFKRYNLINTYKIDRIKLTNFLNNIELGYSKTCPYHNSIHAADVVRSVHYFIQMKHKSYLNEIELFSCIFASIIHDYNHTGLNNNFYINTKNPLAILYNDKSILENMHSAKSFELCQKSENNIFEHCDKAQYHLLRKNIIELVLSTDLALHFDLLGQFKNIYSSNNLDCKNEKNRLLVMKMALKCSDLGHSAKMLTLHQKWSNRIAEEFYRQGDEERKLGIPISPFMDRQKTNLPKSQLGFLDFLVIPLFSVYCKYLDISDGTVLPCMSNIERNREYWAQLEQENAVNDKPLTDSDQNKRASGSTKHTK